MQHNQAFYFDLVFDNYYSYVSTYCSTNNKINEHIRRICSFYGQNLNMIVNIVQLVWFNISMNVRWKMPVTFGTGIPCRFVAILRFQGQPRCFQMLCCQNIFQWCHALPQEQFIYYVIYMNVIDLLVFTNILNIPN